MFGLDPATRIYLAARSPTGARGSRGCSGPGPSVVRAAELDDRCPDLMDVWYAIMKCVKIPDLRTRCKVLTWQGLSEAVPRGLQQLLDFSSPKLKLILEIGSGEEVTATRTAIFPPSAARATSPPSGSNSTLVKRCLQRCKHDQRTVGDCRNKTSVPRSSEIPKVPDSRRWVLRMEENRNSQAAVLL